MKQWWESISERERIMLGGAALFLLTGGLYFFLVEPFFTRFDLLHQEVPEKRQELVWMQQAAEEVRSLRAQADQDSAGKAGGSVMTVIDQTAKKWGLGRKLKRIEPDGQNGAKVWLENVPHDSVMRWLHQLQEKNGIGLTALSLEAGEAQGIIKARLTLSRHGE